jgi:hypothetical protein
MWGIGAIDLQNPQAAQVAALRLGRRAFRNEREPPFPPPPGQQNIQAIPNNVARRAEDILQDGFAIQPAGGVRRIEFLPPPPAAFFAPVVPPQALDAPLHLPPVPQLAPHKFYGVPNAPVDHIPHGLVPNLELLQAKVQEFRRNQQEVMHIRPQDLHNKAIGPQQISLHRRLDFPVELEQRKRQIEALQAAGVQLQQIQAQLTQGRVQENVLVERPRPASPHLNPPAKGKSNGREFPGVPFKKRPPWRAP